MAIDSKNKGNRFEREVYKFFREKLGQECVSRTLGSGSSDEPADLTLYFQGEALAIECKNYKKLSWDDLEKMWRKLKNECHDKKWDGSYILLIKINYQKDWEIVTETLYGTLIRMRFKDWLRQMLGGDLV